LTVARYNGGPVSPKRQSRTIVAVFCIALVVFAAFVPAAAGTLVNAILVALWLVVPAIVGTILRRAASRSDQQPVALLSLIFFRAPPAHAARP
jgi:fatty acid desaturase